MEVGFGVRHPITLSPCTLSQRRGDDYAAVRFVAFAIGADLGIFEEGVMNNAALVGWKRIKLALLLAVDDLIGELAREFFEGLGAAAAVTVRVQDETDLGSDATSDDEVGKVLQRVEGGTMAAEGIQC